MPTTATRIESEILEHERKFWEASKDDAKQLGELCADTFTFVMAEGITSFQRKEFVDMMTGGDYKLRSYDLNAESAVVQELGPTAATIAYEAKSKFEMGGKPDQNHAFYSSTWIREGDRWKCALVTESNAPDAQKGGTA